MTFPSSKVCSSLHLDSDFSEHQPEIWHQLDIEAIATLFTTSGATGLSTEKALSHLTKYGPNVFTEASPRSHVRIFFSQFATLPVALLTVAAIISFFTDGQIDAAVIMGVVAINAIIGYLTESQSEKIIFSLKTRSEQQADVVRSAVSQ